MLFLKKLREGGDGSWEQVKVDPDAKSAEEWVREFYQSNGWAESTEAEYLEQTNPAEETPAEPVSE